MLKLPDVTLVAFGTKNIEGMQKALDASQKGVEFGAVKLITSVPCPTIDEWNRNIVFNLWQFVDTDFCILVHPDGYIVHPESWMDKFREYDYIGAPWPLPTDDYSYRDVKGEIIRVGNSVSWRSKRLLELPTKLDMPWQPFYGFTNEDGYICVNMRHTFVDHGMQFAPVDVAKYWGREHDMEENILVEYPFTFHQHFSPRNRQYELFET